VRGADLSLPGGPTGVASPRRSAKPEACARTSSGSTEGRIPVGAIVSVASDMPTDGAASGSRGLSQLERAHRETAWWLAAARGKPAQGTVGAARIRAFRGSVRPVRRVERRPSLTTREWAADVDRSISRAPASRIARARPSWAVRVHRGSPREHGRQPGRNLPFWRRENARGLAWKATTSSGEATRSRGGDTPRVVGSPPRPVADRGEGSRRDGALASERCRKVGTRVVIREGLHAAPLHTSLRLRCAEKRSIRRHASASSRREPHPSQQPRRLGRARSSVVAVRPRPRSWPGRRRSLTDTTSGVP
jgi:hypothetical protein